MVSDGSDMVEVTVLTAREKSATSALSAVWSKILEQIVEQEQQHGPQEDSN